MTSSSADRPWGSWHVLDEGEGYKVKRIEVSPHRRLSYQTHTHRSEHWVVISGVATCVVNGETVSVREGETFSVKVGDAHRICNEQEELLVIIEIQRGSYTGEDDIVRLADDYGRSESSDETNSSNA